MPVVAYDRKGKQHDQDYQQWRSKLRKGRGPTANVFISNESND
jgi:hypothetical protein